MTRPSAEQAVTALIALPMLGSTLWSVGDQILPAVLRAAQERGFSPELLALAGGLALAGVWVQALYFAGPIAASAAQLQWLPAADVLGRDRILTGLITAAAIAMLVVVAVLVARAMGWPVPLALGTAVLLCATLATVVQLQKRDAPGPVALLSAVFLITALTLAAVQAWTLPTGTAVGLGFALMATRPSRRPRALGAPHPLVPRWQLIRGHTHRWSVNAGMLALDTDIVQAVHESQGRPTRRPLPVRWYRTPAALAGVVLRRALTETFVPTAALVLTALIAAALLGPGAGLAVFVVLQYRLTTAIGRMAESWLASPALQRIWARRTTPAELFAPVFVSALLVTLTACLTLSPPLPAVLVLLAVPPLVLLRREGARRSGSFLLLATPAGPLPIQTVNRAIAGYDVLAVAGLLVLAL
ncbi:hypothetical protein [Kineosporia sp. NBRC 101731]|uniref:hypothetical protein n=1 Tax=Kineosporia sp. NBRC 101731 TaxID=3032199 RepID=UPI0024A0211F|nr:hypothetical protein [Kineosporia sp. NBRC 101731]GLY32162.1 hypothetical protein Kisp02_55270 [Kineosporia sp. NBRC 101731]